MDPSSLYPGGPGCAARRWQGAEMQDVWPQPPFFVAQFPSCSTSQESPSLRSCLCAWSTNKLSEVCVLERLEFRAIHTALEKLVGKESCKIRVSMNR